MELKHFAKKFFSNSIVFILWGSMLMVLYKYVGHGIQSEIHKVYFESFAPKSMMYLLICEFFLVGFLLLIFGSNTKNKFRNFFYKSAILPVSEFGMSFSSVTFGMVFGFAFVTLCFGYINQGIVLVITSTLMVVYGLLSWLLLLFVHEKPKDNTSSCKVRWVGLSFIVSSPIIGFIAIHSFNK